MTKQLIFFSIGVLAAFGNAPLHAAAAAASSSANLQEVLYDRAKNSIAIGVASRQLLEDGKVEIKHQGALKGDEVYDQIKTLLLDSRTEVFSQKVDPSATGLDQSPAVRFGLINYCLNIQGCFEDNVLMEIGAIAGHCPEQDERFERTNILLSICPQESLPGGYLLRLAKRTRKTKSTHNPYSWHQEWRTEEALRRRLRLLRKKVSSSPHPPYQYPTAAAAAVTIQEKKVDRSRPWGMSLGAWKSLCRNGRLAPGLHVHHEQPATAISSGTRQRIRNEREEGEHVLPNFSELNNRPLPPDEILAMPLGKLRAQRWKLLNQPRRKFRTQMREAEAPAAGEGSVPLTPDQQG